MVLLRIDPLCPAESRGKSENQPDGPWRAELPPGERGAAHGSVMLSCVCPLTLTLCACMTCIKIEMKGERSSLWGADFRVTACVLRALADAIA